MATKTAERPGPGRYDAQPRKATVDYALNEVSPDSEAAAFVYQPHDLELARAKREELGLNDDKERAQKQSLEAELKAIERREAALKAQGDAVRARINENKQLASGKSSSTEEPKGDKK